MSAEYDPTEFGSDEEYARFRAGMERELGMPSKPHPDTAVGRRINEIHADFDDEMNREFGGPSRQQTRAKWGLAHVPDTKPTVNGYDP